MSRKGSPRRTVLLAGGLAASLLLGGCSLFQATPPPLIFPTLALSPVPDTTPLITSQPPGVGPPPPPGATGAPGGHISFTCQLFKIQAADQICLMNADGTGFRRLTTDDNHRHFYSSIAPDGRSVVYSSNASGKRDTRGNVYYDIYEVDISSGQTRQVTDELGILTAPEISPDGSQIVFTHSDGEDNSIWLINRDGSNPRHIYGTDTASAWDPTWSPDGSQILFAADAPNGTIQLFTMNADGTGAEQVSNLPNLRGRSDWSVQNQLTTYSGDSWRREIFVFYPENPAARQVSPTGGNGQGPSFSPDGNWVAFTAYYDHFMEEDGCEIYAVRTDGTALTRLTDNDYCDWQPRWGP